MEKLFQTILLHNVFGNIWLLGTTVLLPLLKAMHRTQSFKRGSTAQATLLSKREV